MSENHVVLTKEERERLEEELNDLKTVKRPAVALEIQEATALQAVDGVAVVIYPNPATDFVMVNNGTGIDQVRLYSLTGALVLDEAVNGTASHRLDLDRLPAGAYLLSVDTPKGIITERIMKE